MRAPRLLAAVAIVALLAFAASPAARAHTKLASSEPADGAQLATSPAELVLRFEARVQPHFVNVEVTGPDGTSSRTDAPAALSEEERVVRVPLRADLPAGGHTVRWSVVSADGHRLEGRLGFSIVPPAPEPHAP